MYASFSPAVTAFFNYGGKIVTDQLEEPGHTPFYFSVWLSAFSRVMWQLYWSLCLVLLALFYLFVGWFLSLFCFRFVIFTFIFFNN